MVWILQILLPTLATALTMIPGASSDSMIGGIEESSVNNNGVQQVVYFIFKFYNDKNDDLYASPAV
jgi:hypothetical protein